MSTHIDTACVIGAGIIGSWAALHLAEAGVQTTLVEQFPLPHTRGSSHGASRAFRYLGDPTMDRLDYAMERWQRLGQETGAPLFLQTGLLNFGPPDDPWLQHHMNIVRAAGKPCEWLSAADIRQRFSSLRYPDAWGAAWDPGGGILFAHRCLDAVQRQFRERGGRIVNAAARAVEAAPDGVDIVTEPCDGVERSSRRFDRAVICAGPWTARLLPELASALKTVAIPVTYWRDQAGGHGARDGFPILYNARLKDVYALPACEYPGLVKVLYHGGPEADPDFRDLPGREAYVEHVSAYVREHLPGLDWRQPAINETCMYTITPDNEPVMDLVSDRVVVGCGYSGSGFKHSPASGRMLADLVLGRTEQLPAGFQLERYRLTRPQLSF